MNNSIVLTILVFLIIYLYSSKYVILSFINSHFGTNITTQESDKNGNSRENWISKKYNKMIRDYNNSLSNKLYKASAPPIIHISKLTKKRFIELTDNFSKPLIVKGFVKNSPAVNKWCLQYFSKNYGDIKLPVIKDANIKKYTGSEIDTNYMDDYSYLQIKDIIKDIEQGKKSYVNNVSRIFGYHPELLDDLDLDKIKKYSGLDLKNSNTVTHMFLAGKNTGTTLHCSYTGNFFFNVKGIKNWYLIDPCYSSYLLPMLSRSGLFAVSKLNVFDDTRFRMLKVPHYQFILEEGDLLFNPPWWWHAVKNETRYTIGCANRFSNFLVGMKNNALYTTIMCSHPIANIGFAFTGNTKAESNKNFDKSLLQDILRKNNKIE